MQIVGPNGRPLYLTCLNYLGFNNGNTMLAGLWAGNSSMTQDYGKILYRIQVGELCARQCVQPYSQDKTTSSLMPMRLSQSAHSAEQR